MERPQSEVVLPTVSELALRLEREDLDQATVDGFLSLGAPLVGPLLALLERQRIASSRDVLPPGGMAPLHAAWLLGLLRERSALQPMVSLLTSGAIPDEVEEAIAEAVATFGPELEPSLLAALPRIEDPIRRHHLLSLLIESGARSEALFQTLKTFFQQEPVLGASLLAHHGDRRAVPLLRETLTGWELAVTPSNLFANDPIYETCAALEELGEALTPEERAKLEAADAQSKDMGGRFMSRKEGHQEEDERDH